MDEDLATLRERLRLRWSLASESFAHCVKDSRYMDANDLRSRLLTFTTERWPRRPQSCDALRAAQCGWSCQACDSLKCLDCGMVAVHPFRFLSNEDPEVQLAAVDLYANQLIDLHHADCMWRQFQCPRDLLDSFKLLPEYRDGLCSFGCGGRCDHACGHRYWCVFCNKE